MPVSSLRLRLAVILSFWWCAAVAQQTAAAPLRLADAVARAVEHYPAVIAAQRQADQAQAAVALRRTDALPDVRWTAQFDRATDNNTPGLLLGNGLPTISGPVAAHYAWQGYTTSSGGAVLSWEAYDFGRRAAGVDFYRQLSLRSQEQVRETQLEVGAHAADVYLAMLAAGQSVALAAADVERWRTLDRLVHVLVDQQLRPGADGSRIDAELAAAELALARANDELARQQAALAEAVGAPLETMTLAGEDLLARAPDEDGGVNGTTLGGTPPLDAAPLLRAQQFIIRATQANQRQLRLSDRPRFSLLASGYGRGTSLLAGTRLLPDWNGIAPIGAGNWLLGLGVEYSLTRHWQNKHEQAIAQQQLLQDQARLAQLQGTLQLAERQAQADLVAARQGLRVAPVELTAAETSEAQARARYAAGLSAITDLADAEELLVKAQTDSLLTHLQTWRALLKLAYAQGDLASFLRQATPAL